MISTPSRGIASHPWLPALLGEAVEWHPVWPRGRAVAGWGRKRSYFQALRQGNAARLPVWSLEDGFLRSVGFGPDEPALSVVVDDLGIYYDAGEPSRLESLIASAGAVPDDRVRSLIHRWRDERVSKYNHAPEPRLTLPERFVLAVDQTLGDAAVSRGLASARDFERMLEAALDEQRDATVLLKVHPEVMAGRKRGYFDPAAWAKHPRVRVLGNDLHPVSLIEHATAVYTVTSQLGFEALLWGRPVRTFGMPFYAGWGLTEDDRPAPQRRCPVSLERLAGAALVAYPRYVDPETGERCEVERVIDHLGFQRRQRMRVPETACAMGWSPWKRYWLPKFMAGCRLDFVPDWKTVPANAQAVVWANAEVPPGRAPWRVEDGFIRSVGLGADLVRPVSWVLDDLGIYYDATRPSRLETILSKADFDGALRVRAAALRQEICKLSLTKYNVGSTPWQRPAEVKRVILVPGQVETDASIRWGASGIRTNMALLEVARQENPDAWVVYKPHPDVVAGLRQAGCNEDQAMRWCDEVVIDAPMGTLLDAVDEVHVLTSLAGFEALLRNKKVVCHGLPFYAGWGLTSDRQVCFRRVRTLHLDELVAGVLIVYPTYLSRATGRYTTPENAVRELAIWREDAPVAMPLWRLILRKLLSLRAN